MGLQAIVCTALLIVLCAIILSTVQIVRRTPYFVPPKKVLVFSWKRNRDFNVLLRNLCRGYHVQSLFCTFEKQHGLYSTFAVPGSQRLAVAGRVLDLREPVWLTVPKGFKPRDQPKVRWVCSWRLTPVESAANRAHESQIVKAWARTKMSLYCKGFKRQ